MLGESFPVRAPMTESTLTVAPTDEVVSIESTPTVPIDMALMAQFRSIDK